MYIHSHNFKTGLPPQGLALSIFLSKRVHSMLGLLPRASAAQAPAGPPPTTATLNFCGAAVSNRYAPKKEIINYRLCKKQITPRYFVQKQC